MKRVQHEKSVTWKKCNTKSVQYNMNSAQHEKSAA